MSSGKKAAFVISLDFELMWGVLDSRTIEGYGPNISGVHQAIPRILSLFEKYGIRATWATVGFLFYESFDELRKNIPSRIPRYSNTKLDAYAYAQKQNADPALSPYYFAPGLVRKIMSTSGQELATHTYCHYYCLEEGATTADFREDIIAAIKAARVIGAPEIRSIIFPRNQYSDAHLRILKELGITIFRGNERSVFYKPVSQKDNSKFRRAVRLIDRYFPVLGYHTHPIPVEQDGMTDIPSSRFFSPWSSRLKILEPLKLKRIKSAMTHAAKKGEVYHLWWHPHNMGVNIEENMHQLEEVLMHYENLKKTYNIESMNFIDFTEQAGI